MEIESDFDVAFLVQEAAIEVGMSPEEALELYYADDFESLERAGIKFKGLRRIIKKPLKGRERKKFASKAVRALDVNGRLVTQPTREVFIYELFHDVITAIRKRPDTTPTQLAVPAPFETNIKNVSLDIRIRVPGEPDYSVERASAYVIVADVDPDDKEAYGFDNNDRFWMVKLEKGPRSNVLWSRKTDAPVPFELTVEPLIGKPIVAVLPAEMTRGLYKGLQGVIFPGGAGLSGFSVTNAENIALAQGAVMLVFDDGDEPDGRVRWIVGVNVNRAHQPVRMITSAPPRQTVQKSDLKLFGRKKKKVPAQCEPCPPCAPAPALGEDEDINSDSEGEIFFISSLEEFNNSYASVVLEGNVSVDVNVVAVIDFGFDARLSNVMERALLRVSYATSTKYPQTKFVIFKRRHDIEDGNQQFTALLTRIGVAFGTNTSPYIVALKGSRVVNMMALDVARQDRFAETFAKYTNDFNRGAFDRVPAVQESKGPKRSEVGTDLNRVKALFDMIEANGDPAIVFFSASFCGHCKAVLPVYNAVIKSASQTYPRTHFIDVEYDPPEPDDPDMHFASIIKYLDVTLTGFPSFVAFVGRRVLVVSTDRSEKGLADLIKRANDEATARVKSSGQLSIETDFLLTPVPLLVSNAKTAMLDAATKKDSKTSESRHAVQLANVFKLDAETYNRIAKQSAQPFALAALSAKNSLLSREYTKRVHFRARTDHLIYASQAIRDGIGAEIVRRNLNQTKTDRIVLISSAMALLQVSLLMRKNLRTLLVKKSLVHSTSRFRTSHGIPNAVPQKNVANFAHPIFTGDYSGLSTMNPMTFQQYQKDAAPFIENVVDAVEYSRGVFSENGGRNFNNIVSATEAESIILLGVGSTVNRDFYIWPGQLHYAVFAMVAAGMAITESLGITDITDRANIVSGIMNKEDIELADILAVQEDYLKRYKASRSKPKPRVPRDITRAAAKV